MAGTAEEEDILGAKLERKIQKSGGLGSIREISDGFEISGTNAKFLGKNMIRWGDFLISNGEMARTVGVRKSPIVQ